MHSRLLRPLVLGAVLLLMGCSQRIIVCPVPAILADTASLTVFRPGTQPDLANELYTVSLVGAQGDCVFNNKTSVVRSSIDLSFRAVRAPSGEAATYTVPYFVVVQENAKIYAKRIYSLRFTFAPGAATATVTQSPTVPEIRIENGKLPWNYQFLAGFQMTDAQIEYARKRTRYLP
ncbi:MAG TPA: hypothetical protein VHC40_02410 [Rhizomicrobium sp.]|jgi:hypothetical protein|nr:hypothetical protein [Rhizomicrobium sp.]